MIRQCLVCGREFDAFGKARMCSAECVSKRKKYMYQKWQRVNGCRRSRKERGITNPVCACCGRPVRIDQAYCSEICRDVAESQDIDLRHFLKEQYKLEKAEADERRKRLEARDKAYEAEYPNFASGERRGFCGGFVRR